VVHLLDGAARGSASRSRPAAAWRESVGARRGNGNRCHGKLSRMPALPIGSSASPRSHRGLYALARSGASSASRLHGAAGARAPGETESQRLHQPKIDRILELKPDLAIGFSDIQADIAQALIKAGVEVWITNHRSVEQISATLLRLGAMVGAAQRARAYVDALQRTSTRCAPAPPRCRSDRAVLRGVGTPISAIRWSASGGHRR